MAAIIKVLGRRSWLISRVGPMWFGLLALGLSSQGFAGGKGQQLSTLPVQFPPVVGRSLPMGRPAPNQMLHVTIGMPIPDQEAFEAAARAVSDPMSPTYRQFLNPREIGLRFGQPIEKVQAVANYLRSKGFSVTLVGDSRMALLADCTVSQAEAAFGTTIVKFHALDPTEPGRLDYYSFASPLKVPSNLAASILTVSGLENFSKPQPRTTLTPTQTRTLYNLAPLFASFRGEGRTVGISNWDGFRLTNLPLWYQQYNLPAPGGGVGSNVSVVTIQGGSGAGAPAGEGDLDIQMVLGQAPLCNLIIYDGGGDRLSVVTKEQNDNTADAISESWGWILSPSDAIACHNTHVAMTLQGMTYMCATGDSGTQIEPFSYPDYEPEVLGVGGTMATVQANGARVSEVGWPGGGGGWSTNGAPFNRLPVWQVGNGVPTNINFRLRPDVALQASSQAGAFYFFYNGGLTAADGTSFSSPVWAGSLVVVEQKLISLGQLPPDGNGKRRTGRLQDFIYAQNGRPDVWYDIVSGNNGTLPNGQPSNAHAGWDFVCGWGPPDFNAFANTFVINLPPPVQVPPFSVAIYSGQGVNLSGGVPEVTNSDNVYCTLGSVSSSQGKIAAMLIKFQLTVPLNQISFINVKMEVNAPSLVSNFIYLYNFNTGQYDSINTTGMSNSDKTITFKLPSPSKYVSGGGQVWLVDRGLLPPRLGSGNFNLKVDLANLQENLIP